MLLPDIHETEPRWKETNNIKAVIVSTGHFSDNKNQHFQLKQHKKAAKDALNTAEHGGIALRKQGLIIVCV